MKVALQFPIRGLVAYKPVAYKKNMYYTLTIKGFLIVISTTPNLLPSYLVVHLNIYHAIIFYAVESQHSGRPLQ